MGKSVGKKTSNPDKETMMRDRRGLEKEVLIIEVEWNWFSGMGL